MATDISSHRTEIEELGPWFHNVKLPDGRQTAPQHWLGDFPTLLWQHIAPVIPEDLTGWTVLDIGCSAGFYSFELAKRGAIVTAIDHDPRYLRQARWLAEKLGINSVTFHQLQLYDLARWEKQFDLVWFMGVFYHLRYPLLGLDIVSRLVKELLVFQTMMAPGDQVIDPPDDFGLHERHIMTQPGWPAMSFIEKRLAKDPTNWWAANRACVEAMLRSSGLEVKQRIDKEIFLCTPNRDLQGEMKSKVETELLSAIGLSQ